MKPPRKPFPNYKWRWAVLTPTESLNEPPVFLGILRAMKEYEGYPPNSSNFISALDIVQRETGTSVNLTRTEERNLIRNSGQYWKALNLLGDPRGTIELTSFGRRVAEGVITKAEFASTIIKILELPNANIEDVAEWHAVGLRIKPLELILDILASLKEMRGSEEAYLSPNELIRIVIPLAGEQVLIDKYVMAIRLSRDGKLDTSDWPDCAPVSNDKRMAKEFLLFLWHYGFCRRITARGRYDDKYYLHDIELSEIKDFVSLSVPPAEPSEALMRVRQSRFLYDSERKRVMTEIIARPNQPIFRQNVLKAYKYQCLVTGVRLESVLEAAHIIPVRENGRDIVENGLCLRSDIHILFDSGHLRIEHTGMLHLSEDASRSENYANLPTQVELPSFVDRDSIVWRWKYY